MAKEKPKGPKKDKISINHGDERYVEHTITKIYFNDIGAKPILTAEEENRYANRIKLGDKKARDRMIEHNLRLVVKIAVGYLNRGIGLLDLVEEGNLGLMHAVMKFNPDLGFRFSTYATWWIRQGIERAIISQSRTIRVPAHVLRGLKIYTITKQLLANKYQRQPSLKEIAAALDQDIFTLEKLYRLTKPINSLTDINLDVTHIEGVQHADDMLTPEQSAINTDQQKMLFELIEYHLTRMERDIIIMRFGLGDSTPLTLEKVAKNTGLTHERVRQIQLVALKKLGDAIGTRQDEEW